MTCFIAKLYCVAKPGILYQNECHDGAAALLWSVARVGYTGAGFTIATYCPIPEGVASSTRLPTKHEYGGYVIEFPPFV